MDVGLAYCVYRIFGIWSLCALILISKNIKFWIAQAQEWRGGG